MDNLFLLLFFASIVALVIGLVKPTAFSRFIKGEISRKKIGIIFGVATIASFILFAITTDSSKNNEVTQQPVVGNTQAVAEDKNENPVPVVETTKATPAPAPIKTETKTTPVSTPTPTPAPQNISPISSETISQKNAVKKAKSYLGYTALYFPHFFRHYPCI